MGTGIGSIVGRGADMTLTSLLRAPLAAGYLVGALGASERNDGRARVLMFHGTPRRNARALERALRYLKRLFDVVPLAELARDAAAGDVRFRRQVALTFDDGLRSNVEVAWPILRRLGLPATFFVCPGLIEQRRWLWNHEARQRLRRLSRTAGEIEAIVEQMKALPLDQRHAMEAGIRAATPRFAPTAEEREAFDLADWDALRTLDPALISIGSHTLTHPVLTSLDGRGVERELGESRRALEAKLDRAVEQFAYPNGGFDSRVLEAARRHYSVAVTVEGGFVAPGADPLCLPRITAAWNPLRLALALHRGKPAGRYFFVAPMIASGSQVAIDGNAITTTSATTIMQKKGIDASAT
jgi:peptidoglycan/xylan/chitin deacetylase (PgdA/CDA1 family)